MGAVVCIGQMAADIVVRSVPSFRFETDTTEVNSITLTNGGDAFNTAVDLAAMGVEASLVGRVGDDHLGAILIDRAKSAGIDTGAILAATGDSTCTCVVLIDESGERRFIYTGGANRNLCRDDVDISRITKNRIVHFGGVFGLPALEGAGMAEIAREARQAGCITTMDVTWDNDGVWLPKIEMVLPHLDYFLPSMNELKHIAGTDDPERAAEFMLSLGVSRVVIKMGAEGCLIADGNTFESVDGYRVARVVDTTGAGDAFIAGFLAGLLKEQSVYDCARLANAVGACAVQAVGATAGVRGIDQALSLVHPEKEIRIDEHR